MNAIHFSFKIIINYSPHTMIHHPISVMIIKLQNFAWGNSLRINSNFNNNNFKKNVKFIKNIKIRQKYFFY